MMAVVAMMFTPTTSGHDYDVRLPEGEGERKRSTGQTDMGPEQSYKMTGHSLRKQQREKGKQSSNPTTNQIILFAAHLALPNVSLAALPKETDALPW